MQKNWDCLSYYTRNNANSYLRWFYPYDYSLQNTCPHRNLGSPRTNQGKSNSNLSSFSIFFFFSIDLFLFICKLLCLPFHLLLGQRRGSQKIRNQTLYTNVSQTFGSWCSRTSFLHLEFGTLGEESFERLITHQQRANDETVTLESVCYEWSIERGGE